MESNEKLPQLFFNGDATFSMPCPLSDLRKLAPKWSLAGDAQLLGFMQNFSNKLISQTKDIQNQLSSLTYKTKTMDVKLNNFFNDFNMLANTQFVENRVYDEDSCVLQQPVEEKPKKLEMNEKERDAEMMMMMNEAVRLCKKALVCPSDPVRKDRYAMRVLPTLLNRQQTFPIEDRTRTKSAHQIESSSNDPPKAEVADNLSQTSDASEARQPSSSLESSLKTESLQGRKESKKDIFADENEDSDGDLFTRPAKVPKVPAKDQLVSSLDAMFKDKTTKREVASSSSSSLASDRLAKENKGKVKSLFDESDSAEEDDLFEQISNIVNKRPSTDQSTSKANDSENILPSAKKVPIGAVSVFGTSLDGRRQSLVRSQKPLSNDDKGTDKFIQPSSSSSSSLDSKSKQRHLATKKPVSLFDDDEDDDGDLFSTTNKKPIVESGEPKPRDRPNEPTTEAETRDKPVQKVQKPVPVKSLFDDDDDDDDDEDIFSKLAKQSNVGVKVNADVRTKDVEARPPTSAASSVGRGVDLPKKSEPPKKIRSIFDDDDDDDDEEVDNVILSVNKDVEVLPVVVDVKTTIQEIQNPTPKIKSIFDDDDDNDGSDLFQNLLKSTKMATSEPKEKLNFRCKADASENEPPEALPTDENSTPSVSGNPRVSKARKSLFDDDEDDEEDDLFSSLLKTKPPVTKKEVVAQQPQMIDKPQQRQTTTTSTTTLATDASKQPLTLVIDSKESELKIAISPQKSKAKGDRISKLQNSLNIDPLSLGPFSHKRIQKESIDKIGKDDAAGKGKVEDRKDDEDHGNRSESAIAFRVGGDVGLPSADTTKNSLYDATSTDKSDLNVGETSTLPSLVKGRPKMMGRRRPTPRNESAENADDKNSSQSNANVESDKISHDKNFSQSKANLESAEREVLSNENIPENASSLTDFLVQRPSDPTDVPKDRILPDEGIRRPSHLFGDIEGDDGSFSESLDKTSQDSQVRRRGTFERDVVKDFFDTGSYVYEEKNPCNFKSNDFEPPPLFSDGDDDDDEAEDLFGSSQKREDSSENDDFNVKGDVARSNGAEDKIKEESKMTPEKNERVILAFEDDDDDDDEDLFAPPKPASELSKKPLSTIAKTTTVQVAPMFGDDDDDDDDLFSDVSLTKKSASKPEPPTPNSSLSNGPEKTTTSDATATPYDRNVAPTIPSNPAGKLEFNSGKSLFEEEEDDEDLFSDFVSKPTKNAKVPTKAVIKQGNLFDDSDDDIFSPSTTHSLLSKGGAKAPALRDGGIGKSSNLFGDPLSNL